MDATGRIWVALDCGKQRALEVVSAVAGHSAIGGFKLNRFLAEELFRGSSDPRLLPPFARLGKPLWADIKAHDIPRTVQGTVELYAKSGYFGYLTVHASGGVEMMQAAVEGGGDELKIIAVTVLTSLGEKKCQEIYGESPARKVQQFAVMAKDANVSCLVCSGKEVGIIRSQPDLSEMRLFVPGITPAWKATNELDQARATTPAKALGNGASMLVIGSAIVKVDDPLEAVKKTAAEIEAIEI